VVRRISSGDRQSSRRSLEPVLRPSHSEPLIPPDGPPHPAPTAAAPRRRVARDPTANPSPPAGRRSASSSPAERGPSPGTTSATRGPPGQRQLPPPITLPPPAGGRRAGPSAVTSSTHASGRGGKTDRQHRGTIQNIFYTVQLVCLQCFDTVVRKDIRFEKEFS